MPKIRSTQADPNWIAIIAFALVSALLYAVGVGSLLRYFYLAGAVAVGIFLYSKDLILYTGFTWWIWFLTPLVRRLADFDAGWRDPNIVLLAPFFVTLITFLSFATQLPKNLFKNGVPFVVASSSIGYGLAVGFVQYPPTALVVPLLDWLTPVMLGFHYFINWRRYPELRNNVLTVFAWGVLVMGSYGIWQYLMAPGWDTFWLANTGSVTFGTPEPRGIRVWSTLNSPQPFGVVMMAGLLLLLTAKQTWLHIAGAGVGYVSLLLSLTRSTYVGWLVGFLVLLAATRSSAQLRLIATVAVLAALVVPLASFDSFSDVITSRVESFLNPAEDISYNERVDRYARMLDEAIASVVGRGLGGITGVIDSGVLETLFTLGWLGTLPYLMGIFVPVVELLTGKNKSSDTFPAACLAVGLGVFVQMPLGSVMLGVAGVVLWSFLSLGLASQKYYRALSWSTQPTQTSYSVKIT